MRSRNHELTIAASVTPDGNRTASVNGNAVDVRGYNSALVALNPGTITDGTFTPKLQESDQSGSGFTDVDASDLDGAFAALASNTPQTVGYIGSKRYVRVVITASGSPATGGKFAASIVLGDPQYMP